MPPSLSHPTLLPISASHSVCPCCVNLARSQVIRKIHLDRCLVTFVFPRYASRLVSIKKEASSQGRDLLSRDEIQNEIDKVNMEIQEEAASKCSQFSFVEGLRLLAFWLIGGLTLTRG